MELTLDLHGNIEVKQTIDGNLHRQVVECGDWAKATALGLSQYATANWTTEMIDAWETLKEEANE
jgi:hypothetical protein